uniref:Uncharacterized protein n=1 Tax=Arundo donax TaxID=35708 RepID=A0A0A8ZUM6_ARUDO
MPWLYNFSKMKKSKCWNSD